MNGSIQWLGFVGMILVVAAYVPQIAHLLRARCSAGVSMWAYSLWTVSAAFLLAYAVTVRDPVFISLQAYQLVALALMYLFARRHQGQPCEVHCGTPQRHQPELP